MADNFFPVVFFIPDTGEVDMTNGPDTLPNGIAFIVVATNATVPILTACRKAFELGQKYHGE